MRVGISLIGTPDGFECFSLGALTSSLNIGRSIDLDTSVINILPDTDILAVRRESERNRFLTYVTYYRFAKEIKTSRSGTFYGSSIVFEDFYPNDFSFLLSTLEKLANVIQTLCIDRSENRFHRHLSDDLLIHIAAAQQNLLVPSEYQAKRVPQSTTLTDTKCFLLLDETVPDYKSFLATVILRNAAPRTNLADYYLVYTSKHDGVIQEVGLRRGLDIETLDSLTSRELLESHPRSKSRELAQRRDQESVCQGGQRRHRELLPKVEDDDRLRDDPHTSSRSASEFAEAESRRSLQARETAGNQDSRKVLPANQLFPREEPVQPQPISFARKVKRFLRLRSNRLVIGLLGLVVLTLAGFLAVRLARTWIGGQSGRSIYYLGCVTATRGGDLKDIESRCTGEHVVSEVKNALQECGPLNRYLDSQADKGKAYREQMPDLIKASLVSAPSANQRDTPTELSGSLATRLEVPLDRNFQGGQSCIEEILQNPDFSNSSVIPPTPTATPTPVPTPRQLTASKSNTRRPPKPTSSASPAATRSPATTASPNPSRTASPPGVPEGTTTPGQNQDPNRRSDPTPIPTPAKVGGVKQEGSSTQRSTENVNSGGGTGNRNTQGGSNNDSSQRTGDRPLIKQGPKGKARRRRG